MTISVENSEVKEFAQGPTITKPGWTSSPLMKVKFQLLEECMEGLVPKPKFRPSLTVCPFASSQNASSPAWSIVMPACGNWNLVCQTKWRKSARQMWNPKEELHQLLWTALALHAPVDFWGSIFVAHQSLIRQRSLVLSWPSLLVESTAGRFGMVAVWLWFLARLSPWAFLVRSQAEVCCWGLQDSF